MSKAGALNSGLEKYMRLNLDSHFKSQYILVNFQYGQSDCHKCENLSNIILWSMLCDN